MELGGDQIRRCRGVAAGPGIRTTGRDSLCGVATGLADATTTWLALLVALAGQVGWGVVATRRMGARPALVLVTGLVNLLLGLIIIALKVLLSH